MTMLIHLAALAVVAATANSTPDATRQLLKTKVETMNRAMMSGDFAKVADMTHPKIVERMGGRDKMIAAMANGTRDMAAQGFAFESLVVDEPSEPVTSGSELYAVVPFKLKMKTPSGRLVSRSFVIGVSADRGRSWVFINGNVDLKALKSVLPNLPAALKLPAPERATLESN